MSAPVDDLRVIIAKHDLTQRDVAELAMVSVKTVESWLASPGGANFRSMPPRALQLVQLALPLFLRQRRARRKA